MRRQMTFSFARKFLLITAALALTSCQQTGLDLGQSRFQQAADTQLRKMSSTISRQFSGSTTKGGRGYVGAPGGYTGGSDPYGTSFQASPIAVAQACVDKVRHIPQTADTYGPAMVIVAQCLNRLTQERNMLLTWMHQQGSGEGRRRWSYSMDYNQQGSYEQFSDTRFGRLDSFAQQGFADGE